MWQKILLQSKNNSPDQGFLTLEIIIATLIAFFFLLFSLQAFAFAMFMKVQAQQDLRSEQLIQEDIERLSSLSSTLNLGDCDPPDYVSNSYAFELWDSLITQVPNGNAELTTSLHSDGTGLTLSLSRNNVSAVDSTSPHRNLKIFYQVTNSDGAIVASRYLEIIPDEALRCP